MIAHEPWLGGCYGTGLAKQPNERIAIVGHSHYSDEQDHDRLTIDTVQSVVDGEKRHAFFTSIARWFGYQNQAAFYSSVMFFNFLPCCVGTKKEKAKDGTPEQIEAGRARFLRLAAQHKPDRVFVFSTKGWRAFPQSDCEPNGSCKSLGDGLPSDFNWDTYTLADHRVKVIGVRHPRYADGLTIELAVEMGLNV